MPPQELVKIADRISERFGVPSSWVKAIIRKESSWIPQTLRYEPKYKYLVSPESYSKINRITLDTELVCQKISWGLGQVMGAVAREFGHGGLLTELLTPEVNIEYMCLLLRDLRNTSSFPDDVFAMYNGGRGALYARDKTTGLYPNQPYVNSIKLYLQNLQE